MFGGRETNGSITMEEWADITGWEGYYQISTLGRVRSLARGPHSKEKILKVKRSLTRSTFVELSRDGTSHYYAVVLLMAVAFIPNPEGKKTLIFKDGNVRNCALENIAWATAEEKYQHMLDRSKHPSTKLDKEKVKKIRERLANGERPVNLCKEYGISRANIYLIKNQETWKDI